MHLEDFKIEDLLQPHPLRPPYRDYSWLGKNVHIQGGGEFLKKSGNIYP